MYKNLGRHSVAWIVLLSMAASSLFLPGVLGHHKAKIGIIPADESLLGPEVSEDAEYKLAHVGIGRNTNGRYRRGPMSNPPTEQDNVVEFHERTIIKSQDHGKSQHDEAEDINADDLSKQTDLGPEHTAKLLHELTGLRENIEREIARLQQYQMDSKAEKRTNILVRASRELVRRAERDSQKNHQSTDEAEILLPYRACIYVDIPGAHNKDEGVPLFPETLQLTQTQVTQDQDNTRKAAESVNEIEETQDKSETETREEKSSSEEKEIHEKTFPSDPQQQVVQQSMVQGQTISDDADVGDVLWLHMPPDDPLDSEGMRTKLYDTVDNLHHEGKDVLFIPISKNYTDTEDVKHGFLKSLQVNPERFKTFKRLRVKRM